jgi:hypothetical protein
VLEVHKHLISAVVSGLYVMMVCGSLSAGEPMLVGVQIDSKRDNLFLTELPETVGTWTNRCLEKEKIGAQAALVCWREAAIAVEIYTSALSTPLQKQLHELQLACAQRVAQLQSLASDEADPHRTALSTSVPATIAGSMASSPSPTANVPIPRRKAEVRSERKLVVQTRVAVASPKKQKKTVATKKPEQRAEAREIRVVPASADAERMGVKKQKRKKVALRAAEPEKSSAKKRFSSREAEIRAIREELKLIAKKLECCT